MKSTLAYKRDARQVLSQRLPDLCVSAKRTQSLAIHEIDVITPLRSWDTFEMTVRQSIESVNFGSNVLDHRPAGRLNPYHISHEHYSCSDEMDLQGRFNARVSNPVAAVAGSQNIMVKFSSGKSTRTYCGGIPDVVLTTMAHIALVAGEMKTPWVHDLDRSIVRNTRRRVRWLGQIGMYMYHAKNPSSGVYELWYSPVIQHNALSQRVQQTQPQPADYRGNVSLRECLMYLLLEVQANNWQSDNDMPADHFYIDRTKL
ncbi:hypothetical protein V8E54_007469 [Elaphomyces granulatus]